MSSHSVMPIVMVLALALTPSACGQPSAAPSPTAAAAATTAQTKAPAAPASPTSTSPQAAASPAAAGGPSPADLAAKARTANEYSVDLKMTTGQTTTGKLYVKGTKVREETSVSGQNTVLIADTATKVGYIMVPGQNAAVKADFSQVTAQARNPTEQVSALPADAKFVANDTIDGKPASVYEATTPKGTTRYSIWTERGLPLRTDTTMPQGNETIEFSNYQFVPQPDSLFELPQGTQVIEVPSGILGAPGGAPVPKP